MIDLGSVCVELDEGERLLNLQERGINPVFAVVEAAWVLCGRNELEPLKKIIGTFGDYSDDGKTLYGAYGYRLRYKFSVDQISKAISELRRDFDSRRVVLSLYGPDDLGVDSKDVPCNTQILLRVTNGRLEMTVINRSNDLWLGAPYNWFVFRVLQTRIADELKVLLGVQRHVSGCFHLYMKNFEDAQRVVKVNPVSDFNERALKDQCFNLHDIVIDAEKILSDNWADLKSDRLRNFFSLYKEVIENRISRQAVAESCDKNDGLQSSLRNWILWLIGRSSNAMQTEKKFTNPDTLAHLGVQRWISSASIDEASKIIGDIATNLEPHLHQVIGASLPLGVTIDVDQVARPSLAVQVTLEIILGTLDPELYKTPIGESLISKLQEIGVHMKLKKSLLRSRELSEEEISHLFKEIL